MRQVWILLLALALGAVSLADPPPVINLKHFTGCQRWQLDITYHAKDAFEDRDYVAELEMTATARYILTREDHADASGHWQTLACQSQNLVYRAFRRNKHVESDCDEYSAQSGPMIAPLADLQIGGATPGYMLIVNGGFPAQLRRPGLGTMGHPLLLGTTIKDQPGLSGVLTGPLPDRGQVIHGSRVIPADVPPFLTGVCGQTRMAIEFVLQPEVVPSRQPGK